MMHKYLLLLTSCMTTFSTKISEAHAWLFLSSSDHPSLPEGWLTILVSRSPFALAGYLIYGRILRCKYIPASQLKWHVFKNAKTPEPIRYWLILASENAC